MTSLDYTPRRSVLYMPAANDKALDKARTLPTDAIIFDCEDSVAPDMKEVARTKAADAVRSGAYGRRELTIRVNSIETEWFRDDMLSAGAAGPSGVVVPKVNTADEVRMIESLLDESGAPPSTSIWAMIETPTAVENVIDIASASDRLAVLVMGTNDLAKELHASLVEGRHPLLWGLSRCVNGARVAGKVILDGVYNNVRDPEGFAAEVRQSVEMGFDGKTLVHPSQVEPTNEAFAPNEEELDYSRRVIEAFEAGIAEGRGVITVDGRMIENLHVDNARRAVAIAEAVAALEGD